MLIADNSSLHHPDNGLSERKSMISGPFFSHSFAADFQEFSPRLYVFRAKDLAHVLACEMTLEIKESFAYSDEEGEEEKYLVPVMACRFPPINGQRLHKRIGGDAYLQRILMFQFQLAILEQLLLFCEEKNAVRLILAVHETDLDYLEAYRRFILFEEQAITAKGAQTQAVIPTDMRTYDKVIDFMEEIDKNFRQALWREQKTNAAFRAYLKRCPG